MRLQIYDLIRRAEHGNKRSKAYDIFISAVALLSVAPLMFKETNVILDYIDIVTVYILFLDYIFRWITNDFVSKRKGVRAFVTYPFTPYAMIDMLSIMPSLGLLPASLRILRMLRITKILHYSKSFIYISNVFHKQRRTLISVLVIAIAYIYVSALAMFAYEPDTFDSFFGALYWATTALTTVGYGDVYPVSDLGRLISMVSSLFGVAVIALPAGIVTGGFVEEINNSRNEEKINGIERKAEGTDDREGGRDE